MFAIGATSAGLFARLLRIPEPLLMGLILLFSLVGAFVVRGNMVDILIAVIAGVVGLVLRLAKYPVAPIVIGMALGGIFESKLRQGMISAKGNVIEFLADPIALSILAATVLMVAWPLVGGRKKQK